MGIISKDMIPAHIKQVASYIKENKASAMIGAGYSFNAEKIDSNVGDYSDWQQLGRYFFEKLYCRKYKETDGVIDPIFLASKVEEEFERSEVDRIILDTIPNEGYAPGELHYSLLKLPWNDIYTTNYDTLLENASEKIGKKYKKIYNATDIAFYGDSKRIIKLHGSYPSYKPWIITHEDYDSYPERHEMFINEVKSSMSKNCFCLFGFSGDDPNFNKWMEWTDKELSKYKQPVYIIGVFGEEDIKKYQKSPYKIINMGILEDVTDHKDGLKLFFKMIDQNLKTNEESDIESSGIVLKRSNITDGTMDVEKEDYISDFDNIEHNIKSSTCEKFKIVWDLQHLNIDNFSNSKEIRYSDRQKLIELWRNERNSYPGWFIAPKGRRDLLYHYTDSVSGLLLKDVNDEVTKDMLEFAYELCWRHEVGMFDISYFVQQILEKLVSFFTPTIQENEYKLSSVALLPR